MLFFRFQLFLKAFKINFRSHREMRPPPKLPQSSCNRQWLVLLVHHVINDHHRRDYSKTTLTVNTISPAKTVVLFHQLLQKLMAVLFNGMT